MFRDGRLTDALIALAHVLPDSAIEEMERPVQFPEAAETEQC